jgi:uncharacterized protein with von Willebrand factor type A (vWA) domain
MANQYKNVYTILEKVKKGEIESHYKNEGGLFGKIDFYKKPDLIKPHMHWLDENRIDNIMDAYFSDHKNAQEAYKRFSSSADYRSKIPDDKKPDLNTFLSKVRENYRKFPKHIVKDIFKMYYHKMDKLDFEERTDTNYTKYKFLEKANNPVAKIMSQGSNLKSSIFARNILGHYITRLTAMDYIDPNNSDKIKQSMNGKGDFDNDGVDEAIKSMMESTQGKNGLEKAIQDATDLCKQMDDAMDGDIQERMFENATEPGSDNTAGQLSPDYIRQVAQRLSRISLSMGSLKEKIKKLLDKSVSYFSARQEVEYEDLLNSDNIAGLEEYVLLHPKLRKIFVEDVQVKNTKSVGKIDLYIDISGSMSSGCGVEDTDGNYISRIDFCKSFAAKLIELDMLNNIYLFDNKVKKYKTDLISVSMIDCGGGTTINAAVRSIETNGVNALILTDAEDGCNIYSEKAFFIGLKGANFSHFNTETIAQYSNRDQVVIFNGKTISKVNEEGYVVK